MRPFLFACLLLIALIVFLKPDRGLGLHPVESLTLWTIHDHVTLEGTPRDFLRNIYQDIGQTWARSSEAPNTPFYYQTVNGWSMLIGDHIIGARWLSSLLIGLGLAGLVRLCLFVKPNISLSAVMVLGTFTLPYLANVIHPASLLFALSMTGGAVLFMWMESGRKRYFALYVLLSVLLVLASPYGLLGLGLHGVLLLEKYPFKTRRSRLPLGVWIVGGMVAGGVAWFNRPLYPLTEHARHVEIASLLLPIVIFLAGWAFSGALRLTHPILRHLLPIGIVTAGFVVGIGVNTVVFNQHPNWQALIEPWNAERQALEAGISVLAPQHPLNFYRDQWRSGVMVDLGWQPSDAETAALIISKLGAGISWAIVDERHPNTPILTAVLPDAVLKWAEGDVSIWQFVTDF